MPVTRSPSPSPKKKAVTRQPSFSPRIPVVEPAGAVGGATEEEESRFSRDLRTALEKEKQRRSFEEQFKKFSKSDKGPQEDETRSFDDDERFQRTEEDVYDFTDEEEEGEDDEEDMASKSEDSWSKIPDKLPLLTSETYARWAYDIKVILQVRDLLNITIGKENPPGALDPAATADQKKKYKDDCNAWIVKDAKAKEVLTRSLDSYHHDLIRSCGYARQIFETLRNVYEQKSGTTVLLAQ